MLSITIISPCNRHDYDYDYDKSLRQIKKMILLQAYSFYKVRINQSSGVVRFVQSASSDVTSFTLHMKSCSEKFLSRDGSISSICRSDMVRLYRFHGLQLRTHVINFRLRLQLFENGVIDYKLQITIKIAITASFWSPCGRHNKLNLRACSPYSLFNADAGNQQWISIFSVFGSTKFVIEPESTAPVSNAFTTRPFEQ